MAAPRTPDLDGAVAAVADDEVLPDSSRITLLESEGITLRLRLTNLTLLVEEQHRWLQRQSALLASQSQLVEALSLEGESMRGRIRMLEDRLTIAEDMIVPSPTEDGIVPRP